MNKKAYIDFIKAINTIISGFKNQMVEFHFSDRKVGKNINHILNGKGQKALDEIKKDINSKIVVFTSAQNGLYSVNVMLFDDDVLYNETINFTLKNNKFVTNYDFKNANLIENFKRKYNKLLKDNNPINKHIIFDLEKLDFVSKPNKLLKDNEIYVEKIS